MPGRTKIFLTIAGLALTAPIAAAQVPRQVARFNGQYEGVSANAAKTSRSHDIRCLPESVPDSLSITNGVVHSTGKDRWSGTVSAQGSVVIRNRRAMLVHAHIDPNGTIRGESHARPGCVVTYIWHKQSG